MEQFGFNKVFIKSTMAVIEGEITQNRTVSKNLSVLDSTIVLTEETLSLPTS